MSQEPLEKMRVKMGCRAVQGVVCGRVQGVGFRDFTLQAAQSLGLAGDVRNQDDGTVAFFAQGENDAIDSLLTSLKRGPQYSKVESLSSSDCAVKEGLTSFKIEF